MRLIDADEAVRAVHDEFDECLVWDESGATTANEFENIILQIPTVDAEIVRCKDCKWRRKERKMSKNNNSTYLCDEYQDLIEIRRWCAIFGAVQLVSLILFAIACAL